MTKIVANGRVINVGASIGHARRWLRFCALPRRDGGMPATHIRARFWNTVSALCGHLHGDESRNIRDGEGIAPNVFGVAQSGVELLVEHAEPQLAAIR